jgi:hypothetical protein
MTTTRTLLAGLLASFALMGATCSSTDITVILEQVQDRAHTACAFVPTVETIVAIVAANNPALSTAAQIADAICAEVNKRKAGPVAPGEIIIGGVVVHGYRSNQ